MFYHTNIDPMLRFILFLSLSTLFISVSLNAQREPPQVRQIGEDIQIVRLNESTYIHRSYKVFESYGRVASNGLIYIVDSMCIVFDTPVTLKTTTYLLDYLQHDLNLEIKAVVVNHFHEDCIAGLDSVHARSIPTYGNKRTIELCEENGETAPKKGFGKRKKIKIGDQAAILYYPGAAHSSDNIVAYIPTEKVLFGGCMLKQNNAVKGNLADADTEEWPITMAKVKKKFDEATIFIPGHGYHGGVELVDYTIKLFSE